MLNGQKYVTLRCAGYNNVDLQTARKLGIKVARVPAYSPEAVAEFTVGMILTVVRKYHKAYNRVREGNFLLENLVGMNLHGKTVGIIGTGKIGLLTGKILAKGFGSTVIAYDPYPSQAAGEYGITYVDKLEELLARSDIISLHCPLMESTKYIVNENTLGQMKKGVVLINTSRGGLIDTKALIKYFFFLFGVIVDLKQFHVVLLKRETLAQSALMSTKKNLRICLLLRGFEFSGYRGRRNCPTPLLLQCFYDVSFVILPSSVHH